MSSHAYINGNFQPNYKANVSINDRSIHFADAVYEVIAVYNNKLLFWNDHISRLKLSLRGLSIIFDKDFKALFFIVNELIKINRLEEGLIYIHISRGVSQRNHNWHNKLKPTLIVSCINKSIFDLKQKPINLISDQDIRWKKCHIKSVSLLPNVLLKQKAYENKAFECVLKDENGYITEATTSNVWIIKNETLITTPLNDNILAGVTRKKIIEVAKFLKINLIEKKFKEIDIYNADNTFLSNSSSIIIEAKKLNKRFLKTENNGILKKIKNKIKEMISNE